MREVIVTGKTVEEATEKGCMELGLSQEEVTVEILEMPLKKLFKTIPAKVKVTADDDDDLLLEVAIENKYREQAVQEKAVVKEEQKAEKPVEKKEQPFSRKAVLPSEPEIEIDLAQNAGAAAGVAYLEQLFKAMGSNTVHVKAYQQGDATLLRVEGEDIKDVMETRGDTIQALSYLTDRVVNKGVDKKEGNYLRIRLDVAGYRGRRESELVELAHKVGKEVVKTKRSRTLAPMNPYERLIIHTTISEMEGLVSESTGSDAERRVVIKSTAADATDGEDWQAPRKGGKSGRPSNSRPSGNNRRSGYQNQKPRKNFVQEKPKTSTPEREYANKERNESSQPVVPERREAIKDVDDLPLYGKIEL